MNHILTLSCPDQAGIVYRVSGLLLQYHANIEEAAQYNDTDTGLFFMRIQFKIKLNSHQNTTSNLQNLNLALQDLANALQCRFNLHDANKKMPTLLMVSKEGHCLNDLLFRSKTQQLHIDIKGIISNHRDFYQLATSYNVPFYHLPSTPNNKVSVEKTILEIVCAEGIELLVLARYMQILSSDICKKLDGKAINIHHSFLPSFKGAKPYHQAHDRGVKLIGATAHYVTAGLDEGPIIEQDVARVDHASTVADFTSIGKDTESQVLARAVKWHSEYRVLMNGQKTVVFK